MLSREQFNDYCAQWEMSKQGMKELWKHYTDKSLKNMTGFMTTIDGLFITIDKYKGLSVVLVDTETARNIMKGTLEAEENYYKVDHLEEVL